MYIYDNSQYNYCKARTQINFNFFIYLLERFTNSSERIFYLFDRFCYSFERFTNIFFIWPFYVAVV